LDLKKATTATIIEKVIRFETCVKLLSQGTHGLALFCRWIEGYQIMLNGSKNFLELLLIFGTIDTSFIL
jgi:hypothetical protein